MTENTHDDTASPAPRSILGALDELLRRPAELVRRAEGRDRQALWRLVIGAVACYLVYGVAAGFFQGGEQVLVTALKTPLIIAGSLFLCLPSFYVLTALCGVDASTRWLAAAVIGLSGMLGLLLASLMPVVWLFSVSSTSLGFMVILHVLIWLVALSFGYRFLDLATGQRASSALSVWLMLLIIVSFQVSTELRPVLYRPADTGLFVAEKMFFAEHMGRILEDPPEYSPPQE